MKRVPQFGWERDAWAPPDALRALHRLCEFESRQAIALAHTSLAEDSAMRTTDPDPTPFKPLGERVVKKPEPKSQAWKPLPHNPGVYERPDGKLSTGPELPK